jgi:hypothetical protein
MLQLDFETFGRMSDRFNAAVDALTTASART